MKLYSLLIACLFTGSSLFSQTAFQNKMNTAWRSFSSDAQLDYALAGFCVLDASNGKTIFEKNSHLGMAPASTQKVITTIAAYESLGSDFHYTTRIGYTGKIAAGVLEGDLVVEGGGDPSLGSDRYASSKAKVVLEGILQALEKAGIKSITGNIIGTDKGFDINPIPDGWIWGDMGNYYGAGHWGINWNENQYDVKMKTGRSENAATAVSGFDPLPYSAAELLNDTKTGKPGTGDGSILYTSPYSNQVIFQGKLEPAKTNFTVSGAMTDASKVALETIKSWLQTHGVAVKGNVITHFSQVKNGEAPPDEVNYFYDYQSPGMDSLAYWFLHKSINLYGESFVRRIGLEKKGFGSNDNGLEWINDFYASNGIDRDAMHLYDGSGLSPANRIAPIALTKALYYARNQSWYPAFYDALPTYNGMKIKSGTINRVKCYAGYHKSRTGQEYIVALMINNYHGSPSALISKMFKLLDELK